LIHRSFCVVFNPGNSVSHVTDVPANQGRITAMVAPFRGQYAFGNSRVVEVMRPS
jgi:hypothetical protein